MNLICLGCFSAHLFAEIGLEIGVMAVASLQFEQNGHEIGGARGGSGLISGLGGWQVALVTDGGHADLALTGQHLTEGTEERVLLPTAQDGGEGLPFETWAKALLDIDDEHGAGFEQAAEVGDHGLKLSVNIWPRMRRSAFVNDHEAAGILIIAAEQ